jgi:hypothetical protein
MPEIAAQDRIANLKKARDAAQAVVDEIVKMDTEDPLPSHIRERQPKSFQAQGDVDDLSDAIDDEEAATKVVTVDEGDLAELQTLAEKLDRAIVAGALRGAGLATLTTVLNGVAKVRGVLNA